MASLVLFHAILGLRDVEHALAETFRTDGHEVFLPDLYAGEIASRYDEAFALKKSIGNDTIITRARAVLADVPETAVLSGVSFGASLIGEFWAERPQMAGALLYAGVAEWMNPPRAGLPVSVHIARPDPFDDESLFEGWTKDCGETALELFRYPGVGHYFLDPALPDYDADAATLCIERSRDFLNRLDAK